MRVPNIYMNVDMAPASAASCRGVVPLEEFFLFGLAPLSRKYLAAITCPCAAAKAKGVIPATRITINQFSQTSTPLHIVTKHKSPTSTYLGMYVILNFENVKLDEVQKNWRSEKL
jgi:hypothetical protein